MKITTTSIHTIGGHWVGEGGDKIRFIFMYVLSSYSIISVQFICVIQNTKLRNHVLLGCMWKFTLLIIKKTCI